MGRPLKTRIQKINDGCTRKDRMPMAEPEPIRTRPTAPDYLDTEAREAFKWVVDMLDAMKAGSLADRDVIILYATVWSRYRKACQDIEAGGTSTVTKTGYESVRPCVGIANALGKQLAGLLDQFGLTPSSRPRIHAKAEEPRDELAEFLAKRRPMETRERK